MMPYFSMATISGFTMLHATKFLVCSTDYNTGLFQTLLSKHLPNCLPVTNSQFNSRFSVDKFLRRSERPTRNQLQSTMFGVVFPNRSFPLDISTFAQIDTTHWLLDMNHFVGESYDSIREICIFLLNNFTLPPDKALALYIQSPGSPFLFCGAVTLARPSAVLSLPWPEPGNGGVPQLTAPDAQPLSAKIGVSVEDIAALPSLDVAAERKIERLALKVGENLFNFMQSFCGVDGSKLVVPMDILDRWFKKFQERAKRDPEYLKGFAL